METTKKITIKPQNSKEGTPSVPLLGKVKELRPGIYAVLKKAEPEKEYVIICPKCGKVMFIKGQQKSRWKEACGSCQTNVWIVGKIAEEQKPVEKEEQKPVDKKEAVKEELVISSKSKKEEESSDKKEEAVPVKTHKHSIKGLSSSGKFVWGGFFKKKSYVLKVGVNYIGRTDTECPSDMMIDDEYASRRSVKVEVEKGSKGYLFKLTVVSATNPVLYNGKYLDEEHSVYINYGDIITLGNTRITFKPVSS